MIINDDMRGNMQDAYRPLVAEALADELTGLANRAFRESQEEAPPFTVPSMPSCPTGMWSNYCMQEQKAVPDEKSMYYFVSARKMAVRNTQKGSLQIGAVRKDFPVLSRTVNGNSLIWLDNAATTQKPQCVIDALGRYYSEYNSNIHRGAHQLAREATEAYENAREKVQKFIGAAKKEEIIFVRGTTEAINLVANTWGIANIHAGDEIILTQMEHHSNIVPWQMLAQKTGAVLKAVPIDGKGELDLSKFEELFTQRTRLVAATHVSNVLGTVNPIHRMAEIAHIHNALILVDGAQSTPHMPVDVQKMDADFFAFSGHKIYGPTGIGVLYGKYALLEEMPPYQGGGGMIRSVSMERTTYTDVPGKFEAGTGNIAGAIGLGAAVDYLQNLRMDRIHDYEQDLTNYLMGKMRLIDGVRMFGNAPGKISVVSFLVKDIDAAITARYLDQQGIAVRAGHHCAQPALQRFGVKNIARASIGLYNTVEELDVFIGHLTNLATV